MVEKTKKELEEAAQSRSTKVVIDPPSHETTREVEDGPHQENWVDDV